MRSKVQTNAIFHGNEVISLEWHQSTYPWILTGSSDGVIRLWDLRHCYQPWKRFIGHDYAVRQIASVKDKFLSCSYDLTVRSWTITDPTHHRFLKHHTEFVYGVDICPFDYNLGVDCSWDREMKLFPF